jgi:hypothetical protein
MIKRKARITITEREALYLERRAALNARREAVLADDEMSEVDRTQLKAELAVVIADLETEIDQWKNVRAMAEAQDRAYTAGRYAETAVEDLDNA